MAASNGFAAMGTVFTWNAQNVVELTNISGPGGSAAEIDITNHDSDDAYKEFIIGLLDSGEISLEGNFVPSDATGQVAMITDYTGRTKRAWTITFPDTGDAVIAGNGYVKSVSVGAPYDGKASISMTVRVTGGWTLTP